MLPGDISATEDSILQKTMMCVKALASFLNTLWRLPELLESLGHRGRVIWATITIELAPCSVEGISN